MIISARCACENKTFYVDLGLDVKTGHVIELGLICTKCGKRWIFDIAMEAHFDAKKHPKLDDSKLSKFDSYMTIPDTFSDDAFSVRYYRRQDRETSEAYKLGRNHEYRTMATLRKRGWHCNRRFGSKGVHFCSKCMRHVAVNKKFCRHCNTDEHVCSASLDVTAFKTVATATKIHHPNGDMPLGVYLFITCKWSSKGTVPFDDPTWQNLIKYAEYYGGIPIFSGVTKEGKLYFTDLRTMKPFDIEKW